MNLGRPQIALSPLGYNPYGQGRTPILGVQSVYGALALDPRPARTLRQFRRGVPNAAFLMHSYIQSRCVGERCAARH